MAILWLIIIIISHKKYILYLWVVGNHHTAWVNDGGMDRRITELACHIRQTFTPAPPKRTIACVVAGRNGYKISSTLGCFRASLQTRSRVPRALDYSGPALAGSGTASGVMLAKPGTTAGPGTPLSTSSRVA
jgi:hypothetical protein